MESTHRHMLNRKYVLIILWLKKKETQHFLFWATIAILMIIYIYAKKDIQSKSILSDTIVFLSLLMVPSYLCFFTMYKRVFRKQFFKKPIIPDEIIDGWGIVLYPLASIVIALIFTFTYYHQLELSNYFERIQIRNVVGVALILTAVIILLAVMDEKSTSIDEIRSRSKIEYFNIKKNKVSDDSGGVLFTNEAIIMMSNGRRTRLKINEILFIQSDGNSKEFFMINGRVYKTNDISMTKLAEQYKKYLLRIHNKYIVNVKYISAFCKTDLIISDYVTPIPISDTYKKDVIKSIKIEWGIIVTAKSNPE